MPENQKVHVALSTGRFEKSVEFYRTFFNKEPVKLKPGYAKFELEQPGLNFTLNRTATSPKPGTLNHLGIQVDSTEEVAAAVQRLTEAGLQTLEENDTVCCYALQDKVWVQDPDGHRWEVFVVKDGKVDAPSAGRQPAQATTDKPVAGEACCEPTCCS